MQEQTTRRRQRRGDDDDDGWVDLCSIRSFRKFHGGHHLLSGQILRMRWICQRDDGGGGCGECLWTGLVAWMNAMVIRFSPVVSLLWQDSRGISLLHPPVCWRLWDTCIPATGQEIVSEGGGKAKERIYSNIWNFVRELSWFLLPKNKSGILFIKSSSSSKLKASWLVSLVLLFLFFFCNYFDEFIL